MVTGHAQSAVAARRATTALLPLAPRCLGRYWQVVDITGARTRQSIDLALDRGHGDVAPQAALDRGQRRE